MKQFYDESAFEDGMIQLVDANELLDNALETLLAAGVPSYLTKTIIKAQGMIDQAQAEIMEEYESNSMR